MDDSDDIFRPLATLRTIHAGYVAALSTCRTGGAGLFRAARAIRRMTQTEMGSELGISLTHYNRVEMGRELPSIELLMKLTDMIDDTGHPGD